MFRKTDGNKRLLLTRRKPDMTCRIAGKKHRNQTGVTLADACCDFELKMSFETP